MSNKKNINKLFIHQKGRSTFIKLDKYIWVLNFQLNNKNHLISNCKEEPPNNFIDFQSSTSISFYCLEITHYFIIIPTVKLKSSNIFGVPRVAWFVNSRYRNSSSLVFQDLWHLRYRRLAADLHSHLHGLKIPFPDFLTSQLTVLLKLVMRKL